MFCVFLPGWLNILAHVSKMMARSDFQQIIDKLAHDLDVKEELTRIFPSNSPVVNQWKTTRKHDFADFIADLDIHPKSQLLLSLKIQSAPFEVPSLISLFSIIHRGPRFLR
jgi:hypothetical protein